MDELLHVVLRWVTIYKYSGMRVITSSMADAELLPPKKFGYSLQGISKLREFCNSDPSSLL